MLFPRAVLLGVFTLFSAFGQGYIISTIAGGAPRPANPSASASIGSPVGVAVDSAGNLYFASLNCIFKLAPNGGLTRIAGNYTPGYAGDGGPATAAQLSPSGLFSGYGPLFDMGLAVDSAGNVYIPDMAANRVRKISTTGVITTVAGTGASADSGDSGQATSAALDQPTHLAIDSRGNLYISERLGNRVRMVSPNGTIITVAGGGTFGPPIEGGPAVGAYMESPAGLAVDGAGNLYIAAGNTVRKVTSSGTINTVAGTGVNGDSGDGGPAISAQLNEPNDLAVDGAGNLYIGEATGYRVRKVSSAGIITTVAGTGSWGYSGDGGQAASATVAPEGIALDAGGNLYIADFGANRIRKVSPAGIILTLAGDGGQNFSGDGGLAASAGLTAPLVAADQAGNLYIADRGNSRIRKVTPDGIISTVAGNGSPGYSGDGGRAVNAEVIPDAGVAVDKAGNLFIAQNAHIRKVGLDGIITTVADTSLPAAIAGPYTPPLGFSPYDSNGITVDNAGNLYIMSNGFKKILPDGTIVQLASNHQTMTGPTVDDAGDLYYSDTQDGFTIEVPATGQTSIVRPAATSCGSNFLSWGLATDKEGNLYAADLQYSVVQKISPAGVLYTIAGNGAKGYSGDGGLATSAQLTDPVSIAADGAGNIYVADPVNNTVRVLKPLAPGPSVGAVTNGASNLAGPIAPGEIVTIYGLNLGPSQLDECAYGASGLNDTALNGTGVSFNGMPARIIYASATQAAAIVPYSLSGSTAQVSLVYQGEPSPAVSVPIAASAPAIFTLDGSGKGQAAAINQDGSTNSASNPARPGSFVSLYATGEGQTSPAGVDGKVASNPLPRPNLPVTVTIAGQTATPQYAGGAPGYVAGLMQVNVQIPAGVAPGNAVPVSIQVGSSASQPGVTITVAGN